MPTATPNALSAADYLRTLSADFWSPDFGQTSTSNFSFTVWEEHYQARKNTLQEYLNRALSEGRTILESFSHDGPTADFTHSYLTGCAHSGTSKAQGVLTFTEPLPTTHNHSSLAA